MNEIGAGRFLFFCGSKMDSVKLKQVLDAAAQERGCSIFELKYDEDENIVEVTVEKPGADVSLGDCEYIHRAVLAEFDRNIEDYSMTVSSRGISGAEADELLKSLEN